MWSCCNQFYLPVVDVDVSDNVVVDVIDNVVVVVDVIDNVVVDVSDNVVVVIDKVVVVAAAAAFIDNVVADADIELL